MDSSSILEGCELSQPLKKSFAQLLFDSLKTLSNNDSGEEIAFLNVETQQQINFKELFKKSRKLACFLRNNIGENEGNVAIYSENAIEYFIPAIAGIFLGLPVVNISHTYENFELLNALNLTKPKVVFCSSSTSNKLDKLKNESGLDYIDAVFTLEELVYEEMDFDLINFQPKEVTSDAIAAMLFSSGTTGLPKAVMLKQLNICYFYEVFRDPSTTLSDLNNFLTIVPFTHVYGFITSLVSVALSRSVKFMSKFNDLIFLQAVEKYKITSLPIVPSLMIWLSKYPKLEDYDLSSIKTIFCGAAPLSEEVQKSVKNRLPHVNIYQAYGMTELTLIATCSKRNTCVYNSIGQLLPELKLQVRDLVTGRALSVLESGELFVSGAVVAAGYYQNDEETEETFLKDGWVATGDLGYYDLDHNIYLVDRVKELIKYNGFQVPPAELEALLLTNEDIQDAMVVGMKDERHGELPVAFVVKKQGSNLTEDDVASFVKKSVSYPKYLRGGVHFVDILPKTSSGKLLRRALRQLVNK